jgi:hypothetical protein
MNAPSKSGFAPGPGTARAPRRATPLADRERAADAAVNRLEAALRKVVVDLGRHGGAPALVGGLAVSARVEPRLTRDLDLAVAVGGDDEAERLVRALVAERYSVVTLVEHEVARRPDSGALTGLNCRDEQHHVRGVGIVRSGHSSHEPPKLTESFFSDTAL